MPETIEDPKKYLKDRLVSIYESLKDISNGGDIKTLNIQKDDDELKEISDNLNLTITELQNKLTAAQETIKELERTRLKDLLIEEHMSDVVFKVDSNFTLVDVSKSVENFSGYKPEDLIGKPFAELNFLTPESLEDTFNNLVQFLAGELPQFTEYEFIAKDGSIKIAEVNSTPIMKDGDIVEIIAVARDITERKAAEEEYKMLIDNINDGVYTLDENGYFTFVNSVIEKRSGISNEEFKKIRFYDIVDKNYLPLAEKNFRKTLDGEHVPPYELLYNTKAGKLSVEVNTRPLYKNEKIVGLHGISRNLTGRKQTEEALRESEKKYRSFVENFHGIAYRAKENWTPEFFHGAVEEITGYTEEEFKESSPSWDKIIHPDDYKKLFTNNEKKLHTKLNHSFDREYRIIRKDGQIRWIHEYVKSLSLNPFKLEGALYDITKAKETEEQIKHSLEEKESLLREIHHRVKNNLQVITSMLNLHLTHIKDERAANAFKDIQNRIRSMALIHEKLYRTRDIALVDFNEYIKDLVNSLFRFYGVNVNKIRSKIVVSNVSLPIDTGVPCGLIINELVSNSLSHAFDADQNGEIRVELHRDKSDQATLIVADNGKGFQEEFDINKTDSFGLQLVRTLVEQLKGNLKLNSKNGTEYKITFKIENI